MDEKDVLGEMWDLYQKVKESNDYHLAFNILAEISTITPPPDTAKGDAVE